MRLLTEAAARDKESDIAVGECRHEGADAVDTGTVAGATFYLNLNARAGDAEWIDVGDYIYPSVGTGRGDPSHVVAHAAEEACDEILKIIRGHLSEVILNFGPGPFLSFFESCCGCAGFLALLFFIDRLCFSPFAVKTAGLLHELLRIGELLKGALSVIRESPLTLILDEPSCFDRAYRGEADNAFIPAIVCSRVVGRFKYGRRHDSLYLLQDFLCLKTVLM